MGISRDWTTFSSDWLTEDAAEYQSRNHLKSDVKTVETLLHLLQRKPKEKSVQRWVQYYYDDNGFRTPQTDPQGNAIFETNAEVIARLRACARGKRIGCNHCSPCTESLYAVLCGLAFSETGDRYFTVNGQKDGPTYASVYSRFEGILPQTEN